MASPSDNVSKIESPSMLTNTAQEAAPLAFHYELPKTKAKTNINDKKRTKSSIGKDKQKSDTKKDQTRKKDKKKTSSKAQKSEKNKKKQDNEKTAKSKNRQEMMSSQDNVSKRKAALKKSNLSKQEQKENEIIINYQTQKIAVELAQKKLVNTEGLSSREVVHLKNQLAAEQQKLKPLRSQFDSLKLTLPEKNVSPQRCNIVKIAKSFVGTPYRYGGAGGRIETDCGQFTKDVLSEWGQKMRYRTACGQYFEYQEKKRIFTDKNLLKPGDLVFYHTSNTRPASDDPAVITGGTYVYKGVTHVGIYQGDGRVIHASTSRGRVIENAPFEFAEIVGFGKTV